MSTIELPIVDEHSAVIVICTNNSRLKAKRNFYANRLLIGVNLSLKDVAVGIQQGGLVRQLNAVDYGVIAGVIDIDIYESGSFGRINSIGYAGEISIQNERIVTPI